MYECIRTLISVMFALKGLCTNFVDGLKCDFYNLAN